MIRNSRQGLLFVENFMMLTIRGRERDYNCFFSNGRFYANHFEAVPSGL